MAEQFSWVPLPSCFPNKISCFVSTCVSSEIHFRVLDKSPVLGPGRGPPSCNTCIILKFENIKVPANVSSQPAKHSVVYLRKKGALCLSHPAKLPDRGFYLLLLLLISPSFLTSCHLALGPGAWERNNFLRSPCGLPAQQAFHHVT